jgi:hypothetical protein
LALSDNPGVLLSDSCKEAGSKLLEGLNSGVFRAFTLMGAVSIALALGNLLVGTIIVASTVAALLLCKCADLLKDRLEEAKVEEPNSERKSLYMP